jgi:hypothetical protein
VVGARGGQGRSRGGGAPPEWAPEVPAWTYADRPGARRRRRGRTRRAAAGALLAVSAAALWWAAPGLALALAGPAAPEGGSLTPRWSGPAAFVHLGTGLPVPVAARVTGVAPEGVVGVGQVLVRYERLPVPVRPSGLPAWVRWDGTPGPLQAPPAGWAWTHRRVAALGLCLRRACAAASAAPAAEAGPAAAPVLAAPAAGWFFPGWDPLAVLSPAALSDLSPGALDSRPVPLAPGTLLAAGAVAGVLGDPWSGVWLVALPAAARPALASPGLRVAWDGGAPEPVRLVAEGPEVAGRFVAALASERPGPAPGPPPRLVAQVLLPPVEGQLVPASALGSGAAVVGLSPAGRLARYPVRVLGRDGPRAAVAGLPAGVRVLARPGMVRPWLGPGP